MTWLRFPMVLTAIALGACSTYQDHLIRGQRLYQQHNYDAALAMWRSLEPNMDSLSPEHQARYAYLRGMTDFRLGYRSEARHWLGIAKALGAINPGSLQPEFEERADAALDDLNQEVFGTGQFASKEEAVEHHAGEPPKSPTPGADSD